ncbi:AAA family ATPase [Engelhardtia mirabilis]|uniref:ATPase family associated with various cellular activities (AAA) n=1 Tax=Engelhardtia mirabilis TaxID=2528011 RepID=A0A518BEX5_9BACT|nr:ATPase family associated with various cellular activities (AAA) [Planctomycetes bacterium Pla133]QDU99866.1 ATPase family associated with various cellular activities (AAA) [Planctomycetes bacterium Pla86]
MVQEADERGTARAASGTSSTADRDSIARVVANVERAVRGKREAVELAVTALVAGGHLLIEDVPGTAKSTLARALAKSVDASFRRVQFTADLLPADVLGCSVWSERAGAFQFQRGPIFAHVVLADELNRATPRTQSGLLECMNTGAVSIDGETRPLPSPFFVVATQNPLEFEGTYPLPESQLDRFLIRLRLGYPGREAERILLSDPRACDAVEDLGAVLDLDALNALRASVDRVRLDDALIDYVLDLVTRSREDSRFLLGASPRSSIGLARASRAAALVAGRDFVVPDDIKRLAPAVLGHRVVPSPIAGDHADGARLVAELLEEIPAPPR